MFNLKNKYMPKRKNFSEQEEKQIIDDYLSGNSFRVVGLHFGISAPTVKKIIFLLEKRKE